MTDKPAILDGDGQCDLAAIRARCEHQQPAPKNWYTRAEMYWKIWSAGRGRNYNDD